jgi:hypothetical protein
MGVGAQSHILAAFLSAKELDTHCTRSYMGPRARLDDGV